jgi:hypothetical protein
MYVMASHNVACARMGLLTCLRGLGWLSCAAVIMRYMIGCGSAALTRRCHGGAVLLRQRSVDAASTRRQRRVQDSSAALFCTVSAVITGSLPTCSDGSFYAQQ